MTAECGLGNPYEEMLRVHFKGMKEGLFADHVTYEQYLASEFSSPVWKEARRVWEECVGAYSPYISPEQVDGWIVDEGYVVLCTDTHRGGYGGNHYHLPDGGHMYSPPSVRDYINALLVEVKKE